MLLTSAVFKFLRTLEAKGRRERTIDSYEQRLNVMLRSFSARGITTIQAVDPDDLDIWIVGMRRQEKRWKDHPVKPTAEGKLSEATIAGRIQSAKAFFKWCVTRGHLETSPAIHLEIPDLDYEVQPDKIIAFDDLMTMLDAAEKQAAEGQPRDLAVLSFLIETGCRVGETASLRLRWLRMEKRMARVRGKTKWRWVDFANATLEALQAWLVVRPNVEHDFVFVGRYGPALRERGVYEVLHRLARRNGVEGRFNPHAIRHLLGQSWSDQTNLELVRQKLGHKHISTTARSYSHQDRPRLKKATCELSLIKMRDEEKH